MIFPHKVYPNIEYIVVVRELWVFLMLTMQVWPQLVRIKSIIVVIVSLVMYNKYTVEYSGIQYRVQCAT